MKKLFYLIPVTTAILLSASCGSSSNVASSFGKRKYMKGYYVDLPSKIAIKNYEFKITNSKANLNNITRDGNVAAKNRIVPKSAISIDAGNKTSMAANSIHQSAPSMLNESTVKQHKKQTLRVASKIAVTVNQKEIKTVSIKDESPEINSAYSPVSANETTAHGGTSYAAIIGCVLALVGCIMAISPIGALITLLVCLVALLICLHGLLRRDYVIFAYIGMLLSIAGMAIWVLDLIGGKTTFSIF
ncbi:MAG: hypothetical protein ACLQQ4_15830 [Bacteroidia bacterium]